MTENEYLIARSRKYTVVEVLLFLGIAVTLFFLGWQKVAICFLIWACLSLITHHRRVKRYYYID
ncbi:hypothetical protein CC53_gp100 [Rhizobium phage vB_RleS_L338C]|uniref:hypothetical protein n=1 Tax=Rhizobium phage vB_RleS_L338C TaxID=1414737 RepID=UPI0003D94C81|nr:hypothetical protein CC53_gp100 [Rhizobium phage vB_RleS_L338C]AHC30517.1 hypothetical protein L338C_100 [Rhizobium phage vB_RleS_L338C]QNH72187.1 hypothetical protein P11VFA_050 [Rhizobium phage P11VFA]